MSWDLPTATLELRRLLSDGDTDRPRIRKRCMGRTNGTNTHFQTLEFRRVTDLSTASTPLGVYVNDVLASVASDNTEVGEFVLSVAPANGAEVRASYYYHWFEDVELQDFVTQGMQWAVPGNDITQIVPQLQNAILHHAASLAYQKLSIRWSETWSMIFKLEDTPDKDTREQILKGYQDSKKSESDLAETYRKQFYSRQDLNEQPIFTFQRGRVRTPVPKL